MNAVVEPIQQFVAYARTLEGDEKGEAQVFCDRLFQAFGHGGYKEAGATLEFRVKGSGKTHQIRRPALAASAADRDEEAGRKAPAALHPSL